MVRRVSTLFYISIIIAVKLIHISCSGIVKTWMPHDRYLPNSLRMLFTRFLDITTPPTPNLLRYFASIATNPEEQAQLTELATVSSTSFIMSSHN